MMSFHLNICIWGFHWTWNTILQRVGLGPEQHRQCFRLLELTEAGRPFVLAQQLRDSCRKWLLAGGSHAKSILDKVVLEQFVSRLPRRMAQWVQCHRPVSLDLAIQLVEDQLAACSGVGEPLPSISLSLVLCPSLFLFP
uniref:SCAN box domain-containing protein n=1 Tax=Cyprinus carpio carpio TaxID=630221 RepID=A0A9J7YZ93_CYPCA